MALRDFSKEKFDIIVLAGQSNGEGLGYGDASRPYKPNDRVWYLNPDFTIQMAQERVNKICVQGNLALSFARAYLQERLAEDRSLLILPAAVNGTGFADGRWISTGDLYLRMMEMIRTALELNPENRLVAFLWHQGETDAIYGADSIVDILLRCCEVCGRASVFPGCLWWRVISARSSRRKTPMPARLL